MKRPTELIKCPNSVCGAIQSRAEYLEHCCWKCGSILPLPGPMQISAEPMQRRVEPIESDTFDESKIKKMTEI